MTGSSTTRRDFIKGAALISVPFILPVSVFGANNKINLAWVGIGNQGWGNLRSLADENIVALCDTDTKALARAARKFPKAKKYQDFRKMLSEMGNQIDAVGVATPDHAHFPVAYMAMSMGKHVFVQKPLAHSVWEIRTLTELARRKKLVTQMGNQGHVMEGMRLIKEWYQAGLIGEVREVITWTNRPASGVGFKKNMFTSYPKASPAPSNLDWNLWLGPVAKKIGYSKEFHPRYWRGWWDFGCGGLGDIGCHTIDAPFWALDLGSPTSIDVKVTQVNPIYSPKGSVVTYNFAARGDKPPVKITWYEGPALPPKPGVMGKSKLSKSGGMVMLGSKGAIGHDGMRPNSPRLYPESKWQEFRRDASKRPPKTLPRVRGSIFSDWANGIKKGAKPCSNFDYSGPLAEIIVLGTLAIRTGKGIQFDTKNLKISNNPQADALVKIPARKGWDVDTLA